MASNREWTTREIAIVRHGYSQGVPVKILASRVNRTEPAVRIKARQIGLLHPTHSSRQAIANFEARHGRSIRDMAREYRDMRLSRTALAHDIGIERKALREALGHDLWHSWPHMTIGRIDAIRERRPPKIAN
ncbi:hypothetical protein [Chromohalobacter sp. HP20-39]|uniref:hypothetical protein n=1 Tax=Chromohalobacter sp. HP20-39 TaxID=3079306 RepID=UPI00294B17D1|nr:hypothetical protein [Chromohalobacter sp. HP20-39]MDV6318761.1 hypothetical protein [Chromohalobacter sp. HP20-39]